MAKKKAEPSLLDKLLHKSSDHGVEVEAAIPDEAASEVESGDSSEDKYKHRKFDKFKRGE